MSVLDRYETVIGLEVHAQLKTRTKAFCRCSTEYGAYPNTQICPVCTGQPGALPVFNRRVAEMSVLAGHALNCTIHPTSVFARKNYFYPDLAKGYQISQYDRPLCENGWLEIERKGGNRQRIGITRIHIEEDAGQSYHEGMQDKTGVDYNRCGIPLIEIVSEPDLRSPEQALVYLRSLREILVYLGINDGNMQEGSIRCDVNCSVRLHGAEKLGTRTEVKNMNSFRNIQDALEYEIRRQVNVLEEGGVIVQETRLWDVDNQRTLSMRLKENAHDYRYFPEPDLLPLVLDEAWIEAQKDKLPELPLPRRDRFVNEYGLPEYDAGVLCSERALADYYEAVAEHSHSPKKASNWVMRDVLRSLKQHHQKLENIRVQPEELGALIGMVEAHKINGAQAHQIFDVMFQEGGTAEEIRARLGFVMESDEDTLTTAILSTLQAHPDELERYRNGENKLFGFFMGQIRKHTDGNANMKLLNQLLRKHLG